MRALTLCDGCLRHVRVADARCPFCDRPREASAEPDLELAPRPLPRAVIATLGVTLSLAACPSRSGVTTSEPPRSDPHPVIAAPYGAPPPPPDARPVAPRATWRITVSDGVSMAQRATTPFEIVAVNPYGVPVETHRERLTLRVNGQESAAFSLSFGNGVLPPNWATLPPRSEARDARNLLEALAPAPGEYLFELFLDGQRVAARRITVAP
ncbi:MAG: hypothetical protein R3A48_27585 [Polyangiales bacterium]